MNRKALILASAGVLSLGLVAATNAGVSSQGIARADTHSHTLTEIGFDWRDPLQDGYKPYWRCSECCGSNPASSRFDYKDKTTAVNAGELKISALTSATAPTEDNSIKNVSIPSDANIDQKNATYVTVDSKTAAYFSRSRVIKSNEGSDYEQFNSNPSSFGFSHTGTDAVTSVTFSYRYKSWNYTLSNGSLDSYVSCAFAYTKENTATTSSYSLDNKIFNDDAWRTVTITAKEVGVDSFASLTNFSFKFADLRGYFMISGLSYGTGTVSNSVTAVSFGSVDTSGGDNAIANCSIDATGVAAYTDEACASAVNATKLSDITDKKIYVKVPLTFDNILKKADGTDSGRQAQDYAVGRLKMNVVLNDALKAKTVVKASLKGFKEKTFFSRFMTGNFIDSSADNPTAYGANGYSSNMDTAIDRSSIYALVTLDFSSIDSGDYEFERLLNAFSITANWSAYNSTMSGFSSSVTPSAYLVGQYGEVNRWTADATSELYYQLVPDVNYQADTAVTWVYKVTGYSEVKVVVGTGNNAAWYGAQNGGGNISVSSTGTSYVRRYGSDSHAWADTTA